MNSTYSHQYYLEHKETIRAQQKKYYEKNKKSFVKKYKHCRDKWDAANRLYINEHRRLKKAMAKLYNINGDVADLHELQVKLDYLHELHRRKLI